MSDKYLGNWHYDEFDWGNYSPATHEADFINSINMRMVYLAPEFEYRRGGGQIDDKPDALPSHKCLMKNSYFIADEPVKKELFDQFYKEVYNKDSDTTEYRGYVLGVSWYEAAEFCKWLSAKEGILYRLPTEAEWEAAAKKTTELNIDRMCDYHIREWCFDWFSAYSDLDQVEPAGPEGGLFKVIRGGFLDNPGRYNAHPLDMWMRCALPPTYRHYHEDKENDFGRHFIGFRIASGAMPVTTVNPPLNRVCENVHQHCEHATTAPDATKPYFRKRYIFPTPPDNSPHQEIITTGFSPVFRNHHHSPALTVCPNGDLLFSIYSTYHEYDAESGLAGARLRRGCDAWELPDLWLNPVGVNDHAPNMCTDTDGTIYHFWGWQQLDNSFPFQYVYSKDNGATWSQVQFPHFTNKVGDCVRQPINSCIRAKNGTFYMASDAPYVPASVLWRTHDNMKTWENPAGKTAGRHTTFVELDDGTLLGMGGKNSMYEDTYYMPASYSTDEGDTWTTIKTPFPMCFSGQRPCIIKLASGRLFMCGDFQNKKNQKPEAVKENGSYAAYSDDDGKTWNIKMMWGAERSKSKNKNEFGGHTTLGYSVCQQAKDGMIHVITSNNKHLLHFEFNEAWLVAHAPESPSDEVLMQTHATKYISEIKTYEEYYDNGQLRCKWSGGIADDGRFLMEGEEIFYYPDGSVMSKGEYHLGQRVGEYVSYDAEGYPTYQINVASDGAHILTTYWPGSSLLKSRARFMNMQADGLAQTFGRNKQNVTAESIFKNGKLVSTKDLKEEPPSPVGEIY